VFDFSAAAGAASLPKGVNHVSINKTEFGQTPALGVMVVSHDNPSKDETQLIPVKLH